MRKLCDNKCKIIRKSSVYSKGSNFNCCYLDSVKGKNGSGHVSLDQTNFPKRFWKIGKINHVKAVLQSRNNDVESLILRNHICHCVGRIWFTRVKAFYRNISQNKTGEIPLK